MAFLIKCKHSFKGRWCPWCIGFGEEKGGEDDTT